MSTLELLLVGVFIFPKIEYINSKTGINFTIYGLLYYLMEKWF